MCGDGIVGIDEACDTAIEHPLPGSCPISADCDDGIPCTRDYVDVSLTDACASVCAHDPITTTIANDTCCPVGATNATDADCSVTCGDGIVDAGETCDTAIAAGQTGACPTSCDDTMACTTDTLFSAGTCAAQCGFEPITANVNGDSCCPAGSNSTVDDDCSVSCGNGVVEAGETCDTAIASGSPGACPISCTDGLDCTTDALLSGATCSAACAFTAITVPANGDMCCPSGANSTNDDDCSVSCGNGIIESGETCDTAIAAGQPGACPTSCDDAVACTADSLVSGATCAATCSHVAITAPMNGDMCCPSGANSTNDDDCSVSCGNGVVEAGETCDTAIAAGQPGACPANCNDGMSCTADSLVSAGTCSAACNFAPITATINADGCCPAGANNNNDNDCSAMCGNGVVEMGEVCDTTIASGQPGACPTTCADGNVCTADTLMSAGTCAAVCSNVVITIPAGGDGCCPAGATLANDPDCPVACGDGVLSGGEGCDTAIAAGQPGACPTSCNDGLNCTTDALVGGGTCAAMCTATPITTPSNGDQCCPAGATMANDSDCATVCGDGVVTGGESCDTAIAAGQPGACPSSCNDGIACTSDTLSGSGCSAVCTHGAIGAGPMDSCCPAGANVGSDPDCPVVCGDGVASPTESCDTAIVYPALGSCPTLASCGDGVACTTDTVAMNGTCQAMCSNAPITAPAPGDLCCPNGATAGTDSDCPAVCGDGFRSVGEACDDGNVVSGDGCQSNCTPTCTTDPQCDDNNVCTLASTCGAAAANGSRVCSAPAPAPMTTMCSPPMNGVCNGAGSCVAGGPVCGNGAVESGEICDDGNATRWDGCFGCQFEQVLRINSLAILPNTPGQCTGLPHKTGTEFNVVGPALNNGALGITGLGLANDAMSAGIADGTLITLVHPMDVDNTLAARLGQTDATLRLAFFTGGYTGTYDTSAGAPFQIVSSGSQLTGAAFDPVSNQILSPASVASSALTAGGGSGSVSIAINFGGGLANLQLYNVIANATTTNNGTRITGATSGVICGAVTAGSLDLIQTSGQIADYCGNRSLLDVVARGCTALGFVTAVAATQPNVDLGLDGMATVNPLQGPSGTNQVVNVCYDSSANTRIPATSTDANCAQNAAFDDGYGVALSFTATWATFAGTRTTP